MRRTCIPLLATLLALVVSGVANASTPSPTSPPSSQQTSSTQSAQGQSNVVQPVHKAKVEIVFVLDTTGSMGGLIEGAKRKIWSIASEVQKAQQKPEVRIGLVAYRDHGDEYVTQVTPLTNDVDKVYGTLMQLRADGGGDTPEDVNAGLEAALHQMQWSSDKDTLRMVFLVGDAPAHMDYQETQWPQLAHEATTKSIYVNTVQCGGDPETTAMWKNIANAAEGRYALIPQDGGVSVAIATPYDAELKKLATDLDGTYLEYGKKDFRDGKASTRASAGAMASTSAPAAVAADRAVAKAAAAPAPSEDIVDLAATRGGAGFALKSIGGDAMPDALRGKSADEQKKIVEEKSKERAQISAKIAELNKKREAAIKAAAKSAPKKADSFDDEIVNTLHAEAAESKVLTY